MVTVLKIQRSLFSSTGNEQLWIFNKDFSIDFKIDKTERLDMLIGDNNSKCFACHILNIKSKPPKFRILHESKNRF